MKMAIVVAFLSACLALPPASHAMTGNDLRKQSPSVRAFYVGAVVDTWITLRWLFHSIQDLKPSAADSALIDLAICANQRRMTYEQTAAVVDKYMADNPAEWGYEMPMIVWKAFQNVCGPK